MDGPHPSHKTRVSDASTFDEICVYCGATDEVPGGWGMLVYPCPNAPRETPHDLALRVACHVEDDPCPLEQR